MASNPQNGSDSSVDSVTSTFPPTEFDLDYARLVGPKLLRLATAYAYLVQLDVCSFSLAHDRIWASAWRLGAGFLSEDACDELCDWLSRELLARVDDAPGPGVITADQLARLEADLQRLGIG